jgi:23S rRNA (guanosine2251-2'-O)-methyltransferase
LILLYFILLLLLNFVSRIKTITGREGDLLNPPKYRKIYKMKNVFIALENIRSLHNIGAIFRTCSFFGIKNVVLVGYSGKTILPNGRVVLHEGVRKSSLGSEKDLNLTFLDSTEELINLAKEKSLKIVCVEQTAKSTGLREWVPQNNIVLILGNEVAGVSNALLKASDMIIEIERKGKHNSLNVATTCGIILYGVTGGFDNI